MAFLSDVLQAQSRSLPTLRGLSEAWTAMRAERAHRHRIARELATYTDRELADMGFFRADLPEIARGTYRR